MYSDKFGITEIREEKIDNLSVSIDIMDEPVAVLLHTLHLEEHEHSHIELNKKQATILRDWLNSFLEDDVLKKYENDLKR